ncbi:MAG TPA: MFS transporter [Candidatus Ruania gallistercoris]|uniref:MFS transporter n=1 Tax=Candidatus Ruania gallistercoris TaxID=2838746 RepID=A0A9D2EDQ4_9MICO|nr:MFS transporter [Candidatus Ruania gallistercoris]
MLPLIGAELDLSGRTLGLLTALPVMVFAATSGGVHRVVERFGIERTTVAALTGLALALLLRSWPGWAGNLWLGTALLGVALAVLNVTVPVIVKRDFSGAASWVTGSYVAVLRIFAGLAAALAVPLAASSNLGWRLALGSWALVAVLALLVWLPRAWRRRSSPGQDPSPASVAEPEATSVAVPAAEAPEQSLPRRSATVWYSAPAWRLAAYMGLQSVAFYTAFSWIPSVEHHLGVDPAHAGWHMFALQLAGILGSLLTPVLMRIGPDERLAATVPGAIIAAGALGLWLAPAAVLAWVVLIGLGTGSAFVAILSLLAIRAADLRTASRLSSMAQAVGYTIAAIGLLTAGFTFETNVIAVLPLILAVGAATAALGLAVGRRHSIQG